MKQIDKIIKSQSEPKDINVLWLDTSNPEEPILKEYDGGWKTVAGGDVVLFTPQTLSPSEQAQARTNIGAGTSNFNGNPVLITEQELTNAQKMQARKNQGLYYEEEVEGESIIHKIPEKYLPDMPSGSIILSGLPTASMTSAELEALGFGSSGLNMGSWVTAKAKNVVINDVSNQQVLGIVALTTDYLEFWDATNKYVVTLTGTTLACTVTPR